MADARARSAARVAHARPSLGRAISCRHTSWLWRFCSQLEWPLRFSLWRHRLLRRIQRNRRTSQHRDRAFADRRLRSAAGARSSHESGGSGARLQRAQRKNAGADALRKFSPRLRTAPRAARTFARIRARARDRRQAPRDDGRKTGRALRKNFPGAIVTGLIVVGFCAILFAHDPLLFWNDDYELSILPVFADVARSWSEGHLPLLSPFSWVCANLAGEFQYGTFSIFINAIVVLIWKFPLTFSQQAAALSITHLFILASGAFVVARDRKLSFPLSIFVALIAALNGWIICWGASDWFGALGAFAWLPWAWWGLERALDRKRTRWRFLWPAPFIYLLVTGGFPYTVLMLAVLIAWLAFRAVGSAEGGSLKSLAETKTWTSILPVISGAALGFGLSAPAWLALFDYVQGSARGLQSAGAHWQWIVPWRALPAFILPCWTVNWA